MGVDWSMGCSQHRGPAYRVTVPAVIYIAILRQIQAIPEESKSSEFDDTSAGVDVAYVS
ncbi:hypothetical protein ACBZ90_01015 (plasmid) [Vibrio alginolyticus]